MRHMEKIRLRDSNIFRLICFVLAPLIIIIMAGQKNGGYYNGIVCTFGIYALLAASLNLVNGFSGMFSMGHAAFMAVGAYTSAFLTLAPQQKINMLPGLPEWLQNVQLPLLPALLICGLCAALLALIVAFPVVRFKGHYLAVATLGLVVIVRSVLDIEGDVTNGARGITGLPSSASIWLIFGVLVVSLFIMYRLLSSAYGRSLIAMRDDQVAAQTLGVNLTAKKISIFCISAFFAGIGGALWGHTQTVISGQFFYFNMSFKIVQMSIIGGMASLSGGLLGALFITIVPELLAPLESGFVLFSYPLPDLYGLSNIIMSVFLVVLIIYRRQGLMGNSEILLDTFFSKNTYTSVFKKDEYKHFAKACINLCQRKKKS